MLNKIILTVILFSFALNPLETVNAEELNDNEQTLIKQHQMQANKIEMLNNSFITEINHMIYFFPKNLNVVTLGDSLTQGVGDESENAGYVGLIEDFLDNQIEIDNFGVSGYRSDQLLKLIDEPNVDKSLIDADIVLMTIGANDLMKVFKNNFTHLAIEPFIDELNQFEVRLNNIFTKIHEINPHAKIYLIGFYDPFSEFFPEVEELSDISSSWNTQSEMITNELPYTYYIPTQGLFKAGIEAYLSTDKFHPNKNGYTKIATEVIDHIKTGVDDSYDTK